MIRRGLIFFLSATSVFSSRVGLFDDDLYKSVLNPELCEEQLKSMSALEFYDASFRIPQGILKGGLSSIGDYKQCLGINQAHDTGNIEGKYCMTEVTIAADGIVNIPVLGNTWQEASWKEVNVSKSMELMKKYEQMVSRLMKYTGAGNALSPNDRMLTTTAFSLAVCIPKTCSVDDVMGRLTAISPVSFNYTEQFCRLPGDKLMSTADYFAIVLLIILGLLTALSTAYDLNHRFILKKDPKTTSRLYSCASVYTNMKRLTTFSETAGSLNCLDGIRSISILWIIMGHLHGLYLTMYVSNVLEFLEWFEKIRAIWLSNAGISVDTFFTMSGLLLVYTTANKLNQRKLVQNLHWFYLNRILRILPLLACVVLLESSVFFRVTDGPNWWNLGSEILNCREYWWSTLLHVQNWVNPLSVCVPQTWYLAVDLQLYLLSPLLLFWVLGGRRSAWAAFTFALPAAITANVLFCYLFDLNYENSFSLYYNNTLIRSPPFLIGMLCGYLLHLLRGREIRLPVWAVALGYTLAGIGSSYAMYHVYPGWETPFVVNFNLSFEKTIWSLSLCWVIFTCVKGYGGPVNWFLSLTIWKFTARISYAMYIFHFSIMYMNAGALTQPFYYSMENIWMTFAGVTAYTLVVSVAACVLVDAPFSTLQKLMMAALSPVRPSPKSQAPTIQESKISGNPS